MNLTNWFVPEIKNAHPILIVGGEKHIVRLIEVNLRRQKYEFACSADMIDMLTQIERVAYELCIIAGDLADSTAEVIELELRAKVPSIQVLRLDS
jgi:DNA-binding NtrC family response regulator